MAVLPSRRSSTRNSATILRFVALRLHAAATQPLLLYGRPQPAKATTVRPDHDRGGTVERSENPPSEVELPDGPHPTEPTLLHDTTHYPAYSGMRTVEVPLSAPSAVPAEPESTAVPTVDHRAESPADRPKKKEKVKKAEKTRRKSHRRPPNIAAARNASTARTPGSTPMAAPAPWSNPPERCTGLTKLDLVLSGPAGVAGCRGHERCR